RKRALNRTFYASLMMLSVALPQRLHRDPFDSAMLLRCHLSHDLEHDAGAEQHVLGRDSLIVAMNPPEFFRRELEWHESITRNPFLSKEMTISEAGYHRRR